MVRPLCLLLALAHAETSLEVQLEPGVDGPREALSMTFDKRLTFVMPGPVRLAVPGSPDVLRAHVKDNVVVASLVDSDYVRARKPLTNLTILTTDGQPFTCRIAVVSTAAEAPLELVRVAHGAGRRRHFDDEAVRLVEAWLADRAPSAVRRRLEGLSARVDERAKAQLARWVALGGAEQRTGTGRSKQDFIDLTRRGRLSAGDVAVLHLELRNHTQPPFTVGEVRLVGVDGPLTVSVPEPLVPPDGKPRGVGVLAPLKAVDSASAVEVCEQAVRARCVRLELR